MGRAKKATQAAKPAKATGKKPPGRPRKVKEPVQEEEPAEDAPADDQADDEKDSGRSEPADDATPMDDADPVEAKATDDDAPAVKEDLPAPDGEAGDKTKEGGDEPREKEKEQQKDKEQEKEETVRSCLRIVVPSDKAGYVIGPRGKVVAHMRKESGCGFHLQETSKAHAMRVAVVTCSDKQYEQVQGVRFPAVAFQGVRGVEMVYLRSTEEMIPKDADLNDPPMGARPGGETRTFVVVAASQMDKADLPELASGAGADCEKIVALDEGSVACETLHAALGSIVFPTDRFIEISGTDASVRAALTVLTTRLDYRANPPIASEDPLLLIDAPDVKEGYFREKKEKDRLRRHRDSHGAGRDGRGRHHPYGGGGGGGGNHNRGPPPRGGGGDEIRMTFEIDAAFAGGVIGKMGSNVGQIRRESGARVTVHESHGKFREVAIEGTDRQCHDAKHLVQQAVNKQGGGPVGAHGIEPLTGRGGRDGRGRVTAGAGLRGGSYYDRYDRRGRGDRGYDRGGYDRGGYDRGGYDRGGYDRGGYDRGGGYGRDAHYDAGAGSAYAEGSYPDRGGYGGGERDARYDERDTHRQWLGGDRDGGYNNYQGVQQSHQQQQGWAGQNQQWGGSNQQQSYNNQQPYHGQQQSYDQGAGYNNNQQGGGNHYYNRGQQQSGYGNQGGQYDQQGDYYSRGQQWGGSRY